MAKMPTFTVSVLMIVVSVVAVNIAAAQWFYDLESQTLPSLSFMGLCLQFAGLRIIQSRERAYWSGFLILGGAAMTSLILAFLYRPSWAEHLWTSYGFLLEAVLRRMPPIDQFVLGNPDPVAGWMIAFILFGLPMILPAMIGGYLATGLARLASVVRPQPWRVDARQESDQSGN